MTAGKGRLAPPESSGAHEPVALPSNRHFGLVVGAIACAIGMVSFFSNGAFSVFSAALAAAGAALVLFAFVAPGILTWPNGLWMKLGVILGLVMTPIVMGLVYATTFLPIAMILRFAGKDPLRRQRKAQGESYWIERAPPGPDPATMQNQF